MPKRSRLAAVWYTMYDFRLDGNYYTEYAESQILCTPGWTGSLSSLYDWDTMLTRSVKHERLQGGILVTQDQRINR